MLVVAVVVFNGFLSICLVGIRTTGICVFFSILKLSGTGFSKLHLSQQLYFFIRKHNSAKYVVQSMHNVPSMAFSNAVQY